MFPLLGHGGKQRHVRARHAHAHVSEGAASLCLVALLALFPSASRAQSIREISLASERWSVCSSEYWLISSERFVVSSYTTLSLEFKLRQWESRQGESPSNGLLALHL